MSNESETSTLQPTALVHEAWLRLVSSEPQIWQNRGHFFAAAAEAMRRILIDRARRKFAMKRGAGTKVLNLEDIQVAESVDDGSLLLIDEALERLAAKDEQSAQLVKLRFFVGMSYQQAAEVLGISERSAKRSWTYARAWLFRELSRQNERG
jgi:RNA polymerase sigma factor (TIGR02999 family)